MCTTCAAVCAATMPTGKDRTRIIIVYFSFLATFRSLFISSIFSHVFLSRSTLICCFSLFLSCFSFRLGFVCFFRFVLFCFVLFCFIRHFGLFFVYFHFTSSLIFNSFLGVNDSSSPFYFIFLSFRFRSFCPSHSPLFLAYLIFFFLSFFLSFFLPSFLPVCFLSFCPSDRQSFVLPSFLPVCISSLSFFFPRFVSILLSFFHSFGNGFHACASM